LLLELPAGKAQAVREIAAQSSGLHEEETIRDYQDIERVLVLAAAPEDSWRP